MPQNIEVWTPGTLQIYLGPAENSRFHTRFHRRARGTCCRSTCSLQKQMIAAFLKSEEVKHRTSKHVPVLYLYHVRVGPS